MQEYSVGLIAIHAYQDQVEFHHVESLNLSSPAALLPSLLCNPSVRPTRTTDHRPARNQTEEEEDAAATPPICVVTTRWLGGHS